jgi:WxL domain surface cell wall-binding
MSPLYVCGGLARRLTTRRLAVGLGVLSALALAPSAQAATTSLDGTVQGGSLSNTAPTIANFNATLSGLTQTVDTAVGAWSVTDATGSNDGYSVTVAASAPSISNSTAADPTPGSGFALQLTPATATAASGNPASTAPVAESTQTLGTTATTIENAPAGTGQGEWDFPADSNGNNSLGVLVPGDASNGDYSITLTFTTAPPVA